MNFARLLSVYSTSRLVIASFVCCCFVFISSSHASDFSTDVVGITEAHLSSDFWLNKLAKQNHKADILMSAAQIEQFNKRLIVKNPYLSSPLLMPNFLTNVELKEKVNQISSVPTASRFYATGKRVTTENYADYIKKY